MRWLPVGSTVINFELSQMLKVSPWKFAVKSRKATYLFKVGSRWRKLQLVSLLIPNSAQSIDEVLKKSVVDSNLVYENSNDAGTGVKFKSDSTSHAATQKWRSSTGSRVSSIIGRILRGEDVGKKHFQYVPKREP